MFAISTQAPLKTDSIKTPPISTTRVKTTLNALSRLVATLDPNDIPKHLKKNNDPIESPSWATPNDNDKKQIGLTTAKVALQATSGTLVPPPVAIVLTEVINCIVLADMVNHNSENKSAAPVEEQEENEPQPDVVEDQEEVEEEKQADQQGTSENASQPAPKAHADSAYHPDSKSHLAAIGAGLTLMATAVAAEETSTQESQSSIIDISTVDDLNNIGRNDNYPASGHYQQTQDIDASNFTKSIDYFSGTYDGGCHTIDKMPHCMLHKIEGGSVSNLRLANSNITTAEKACTLASYSANSRFNNNRIENAQITTTGKHGYDGIVFSQFQDSNSNGLTVVKSNLDTSASYYSDQYMGCVAGKIYSGILLDTFISECHLIKNRISSDVYEPSGGLIVGRISEGPQPNTISKLQLINSLFDCNQCTYCGLLSGKMEPVLIADNLLLMNNTLSIKNHLSLISTRGEEAKLSNILLVNNNINIIGSHQPQTVYLGAQSVYGSASQDTISYQNITAIGNRATTKLAVNHTIDNTKKTYSPEEFTVCNTILNGEPKEIGTCSPSLKAFCKQPEAPANNTIVNDQQKNVGNCTVSLETFCEQSEALTNDCQPNKAYVDNLSKQWSPAENNTCSDVMPVMPDGLNNPGWFPAILTSTAFLTTVGVGVGIALGAVSGYSIYHWVQGSRAGLSGKELARYPFTRQKNERQPVPTEDPSNLASSRL